MTTENPVVLIVDDDPALRRMLLLALSGYPMTLETAEDGLIALARVRGHSPDLVVLDLQMPNMDGTELMHCMQRESLTMPVILVSADSGLRDTAVRLGATAAMAKPFDPDDLAELILEVLAA